MKCFPQIDPDLPSTFMHPQTPGRPSQGLLAALRSTLQGSPRRLLRRVRLMGGRDLTTGQGPGQHSPTMRRRSRAESKSGSARSRRHPDNQDHHTAKDKSGVRRRCTKRADLYGFLFFERYTKRLTVREGKPIIITWSAGCWPPRYAGGHRGELGYLL